MGAAMLMHRKLTKDITRQEQQETLYEGPAYCHSLNEIEEITNIMLHGKMLTMK